MNGTTHAAIGTVTGFIIANNLQSPPAETALLVSLGTISALIPDLDIDGKLRGKITLSHKLFRTIAQVIGLLLIIYSFYEGEGMKQWIGAGSGFALLSISIRLKQKHMLTITGVGVIIGGLALEEQWLLLLGIYIIMASLVAHRSYTHSILGVIFFGFIAFYLHQSLRVEGVYYTCLIGYITHLVADSKILPFNKRGVKLFLPFWNKEF
ncbi:MULTISPECIES: metal-dependent hydrolase [Virgibacillus]|uniref:Hydrolase n=1 Tax=Virgibacillus pantothenticus TaxID=1473 RepID=A0A0L0QMR7_VIRPA|nr:MULTISPECIES: metal-dependent hydrolase [Virgibacillus]API93611.1 hydrolase [Virgibacillus sp. 6R]KNE19902.1 hydrolase [Virgibacillus pantothenticus]MBS7429997.1 metal-dependent hydrolase [Virgibacillus sp. 19R1-5]MBU8564905.1 metal-dependent hydrolase [Virgibacillus pantothenticus]MBU8599213.1 metal-dependent hydrolase [Virgibacillus pantothenticus]